MPENDSGEFGKYTHWPERKTYAEEKSLVKAAAGEDAEGTGKLKEYLRPLVTHWATDFRIKYPEIVITNERIMEAGFLHLDLAVRKYNEHLDRGEPGFKFSTYFEWFIRQGFLDYFKKEINK